MLDGAGLLGSPTTGAECDQDEAKQRIAETLKKIGVDLARGKHRNMKRKPRCDVLVVLGRAGTGKTHLLQDVVGDLLRCGLKQVADETEPKSKKKTEKLTFAVACPTNKAAFVLRKRGVSATTIHKLAYSPIYKPEMEALIDWLEDPDDNPRPDIAEIPDDVIDKIRASFDKNGSFPAALASVGLRGVDFVKGWGVRDTQIDVGLLDESSMIDRRMFMDCKKIFRVMICFGDPAQLNPVKASGMAIVDDAPGEPVRLQRIRRQTAGNPIIDLAHALHEPNMTFEAFERLLHEKALADDRIRIEPKADADLMSRMPLLVWRNATRLRVTTAWRRAHGLEEFRLGVGEPLIVNGIETSSRGKSDRQELERKGLVKGAQAIYLGPGNADNYVRLAIQDSDDGPISVAAIVEFERADSGAREIERAAKHGVILAPCPCLTIHKSQGSQGDTIQVFGPDIRAAAESGRTEAGIALWKRLSYVAITRAQERLIWVTDAKLTRPTIDLSKMAG